MLGYYADNRRFGRFGFRTEERSLAMKRRDAVYKALCGVWIAALVVPLVVYAASFGQGVYPDPDGGSGPPITAYFTWQWNVTNTHTYTISGQADPGQARLMREIPFWPDDTVINGNPPVHSNSSIPHGATWYDEDQISGSVMFEGNYYHWTWASWPVNGSCGHSGSYGGGDGASYWCN
jgi:hypothetical protein